VKIRTTALFLACATLPACLSKEPPLPTHYFHPALEPLAGEEVPGTIRLRFEPMTSGLDIGGRMLWRVSETEWMPDEANLWARSPRVLLEERLRDRLFGIGGYRESLVGDSPILRVQLVAFHGIPGPDPSAQLELILDLSSPSDAQYRTRITIEEPLTSVSPEALAEAMGTVLARAAEESASWMEMRLRQ